MEILQRKMFYHRPYHIDNMEVKSITFYSDKGIICTTNYGYLGDENKKDIKSVTVCDIKRVRTIRDNSKRATKAEKLMQEHINFSISLGADDFNDKLCELYLYVDNTFIKHTSNTVKQRKELSDFTLQERHITTTINTFNISGANVSVFDTTTTYNPTTYSELVQTTKQELDKKLITISNSDLAELLNRYSLVKREIPLTEQFRRENSEVELIK